MKFPKTILLSGLIAIAALGVFAQGLFDRYSAPATQVITTPTTLNQSGTTTLLTTNGVYDISRYSGIVSFDLLIASNSASYTAGSNSLLGVVVQGSMSPTNGFATMTTWSQATSTAIIRTNYYGTTNSQYVLITNTYMLPGILTNWIPSVNGFAGQAILPNPFTNSASFTATGSTTYKFGFNAQDAPRYIQIIYTLYGSNAVWTVAGELTGASERGNF